MPAAAAAFAAGEGPGADAGAVAGVGVTTDAGFAGAVGLFTLCVVPGVGAAVLAVMLGLWAGLLPALLRWAMLTGQVDCRPQSKTMLDSNLNQPVPDERLQLMYHWIKQDPVSRCNFRTS